MKYSVIVKLWQKKINESLWFGDKYLSMVWQKKHMTCHYIFLSHKYITVSPPVTLLNMYIRKHLLKCIHNSWKIYAYH